MLTGLSGSLLSQYFAEHVLPVEFAGLLGEASVASEYRNFVRWWQSRASQLGPASSVRAIWDVAAAPLAEQLGFSVGHASDTVATRHAPLTADRTRISLAASSWDVPLDSLWRDAVRRGIALQAPWVLCTNGRQLRLIDAQRTYARSYLEFDFAQTAESRATFAVLWGVLRHIAFKAQAGETPLLLQVLLASMRHGQAVNHSLRMGVLVAVQHVLGGLYACRSKPPAALFDESLTVVYRILFLMFAESRSLVPNWHPVYKESYTIESLRDRAERPGPATGLWEALQAIARMAHVGCRAGTLIVPAFNGRLFSPSRSPLAESCAIDDEVARKAMMALSTTGHRSKRARIDYRDLGVEQLGAVYESVLDYQPTLTPPEIARAPCHGTAIPDGAAANRRIQLWRAGNKRKSTGSFYTPQSITDYVVRRTLHPIVATASAERILSLRIVDPAMGSAAFLVSACRYLARKYERALVREEAIRETDIDEADRALFRRQIAQRCLFGVDLNPTAVQLARLSLWLVTLAAGRPLTFLDHRLTCGNSLLGASLLDLARQPPTARSRATAGRMVPTLFSDAELEPSLARAVAERRWLAETSDDTAEVVREKEDRLEAVHRKATWRSLADLWCSCWMWPERASAPDASVFGALADRVTSGKCELPDRVAAPLLDEAGRIARAQRFFHWMIEFPEVFFDADGQPLADGGFDAVLGNPPWSMVRSEGPEKHFLRGSGVYRHQGSGHINRYQLFVERALGLVRRRGRIGLVLPSGFATDHTSAPLRRHLLSHTNLDAICGFDNRHAIFPIHRSVRFLVCTATNGMATSHIACRFGIDDATELERFPDSGQSPAGRPPAIVLTPAFISAFDSEKLAIPELRAEADLRILERIVYRIPRLDDREGWGARFGRELNATDDRAHFQRRRAGLPVLEGKHIEPFRAHGERALASIPARAAAQLLDAPKTYLALAVGIPRCGERLESALAHRGNIASGCRHDTLAVLPEDPIVDRQPGFSLRDAQQLCRELPGSAGDDHPSRLGDCRSPACAQARVRLSLVP